MSAQMRKLLDLAIANRGKGAGLRSEADADTTHVYVYDVIDPWWGVNAVDFAQLLSTIKTANIVLHVNSPGGDVFEARAMMAAAAAHPATVTAKIDGLAASAASTLVLAADSVEIVEGGFYMIHNAWTFAMGNAAELRTTADLLDKVDGTIADSYEKKSGMARDAIVAAMAAETWYTAQDAIDAGFCDSLIEIQGAKAKALRTPYNLGAYEHAPKALTEALADEAPDADAARARMMARLHLYERT